MLCGHRVIMRERGRRILIATVGVLALACRDTERIAMRKGPGQNAERARIAILEKSLARLKDGSTCLAVDSRVLPSASSLIASDDRAILADMSGLFGDPPSTTLQALTPVVRRMSECPQRDWNPDWYHVRSGPLRLVGPANAEMVVSTSLDGLLEVELCSAVIVGDSWVHQACQMKFVS